MLHIKTVYNLRTRYVIGLSAIAVLVTASFLMMQHVVSKQRSYATLVNLAGHQAGLSNRISFFAGIMATTDDEAEFNMAKSQVGRSINRMRINHQTLRQGDPERDIPVISNATLDTIYDDPMVGLEYSLYNFLENAEKMYEHDPGTPFPALPSYIYLTTYGPHVLEPLLDAAVDEYEAIGSSAIVKIERFEQIIWIATLFTLLCELAFIFIPLEGNVKKTLRSLEQTINELQKTRKRLLMAQKLAVVGDWEYDTVQNKFTLSEQVYSIFGIKPREEPVSSSFFMEYVHPEDHGRLKNVLKASPVSERPDKIEFRVVRPDGSERLIYQYSTAKKEGDGPETQLYGTVQDITERKELSTRLEKLSEHVPGFIFQCHKKDGRYSFTYVSNGILATCGTTAEQLETDADNFFNLINKDDIEYLHFSLEESAKNLETWQSKFRLSHQEKGVVWLEGHATPGRMIDGSVLWYGYVWDITERKEAEDRIHKLALYDPLTGLANRRLMRDRLKKIISLSQRNRSWGAIIMLDLDNFKTLNDTKGHEMGDALLVEVAERLHTTTRECDTVSRLGGDEFIVLLSELGENHRQSEAHALTVSEKIRDSLHKPYLLNNGTVIHHGSASIGVTLFFGRALDESTLLKRADVAMYEAKERGRNQVCFYSELRQQEINEKSALITDMQKALKNDEFALYFQPQIDRRGNICGAEALLRWFPENKEPISPALFIPLAESSSLIVPIGEWVLAKACDSLAKLQRHHIPDQFYLAVNISALQFSDAAFLKNTKQIIKDSGVAASQLKFEITESCLVKDFEAVNSVLEKLRHLGIRIELDDFGTGYSSLMSLYNLPINGLKIDRSLVSNINSNNSSKALIRATIAMGRAMAMEIIAEGVETLEESNFLTNEGTDIQQGFYFSRPLCFDDFVALLASPSPKKAIELWPECCQADFVLEPHPEPVFQSA